MTTFHLQNLDTSRDHSYAPNSAFAHLLSYTAFQLSSANPPKSMPRLRGASTLNVRDNWEHCPGCRARDLCTSWWWKNKRRRPDAAAVASPGVWRLCTASAATTIGPWAALQSCRAGEAIAYTCMAASRSELVTLDGMARYRRTRCSAASNSHPPSCRHSTPSTPEPSVHHGAEMMLGSGQLIMTSASGRSGRGRARGKQRVSWTNNRDLHDGQRLQSSTPLATSSRALGFPTQHLYNGIPRGCVACPTTTGGRTQKAGSTSRGVTSRVTRLSGGPLASFDARIGPQNRPVQEPASQRDIVLCF